MKGTTTTTQLHEITQDFSGVSSIFIYYCTNVCKPLTFLNSSEWLSAIKI